MLLNAFKSLCLLRCKLRNISAGRHWSSILRWKVKVEEIWVGFLGSIDSQVIPLWRSISASAPMIFARFNTAQDFFLWVIQFDIVTREKRWEAILPYYGKVFVKYFIPLLGTIYWTIQQDEPFCTVVCRARSRRIQDSIDPQIYG